MSNITQFTTGGVKSVQRGVYSAVDGESNLTTVTISAVNPAKSMVLLNGTFIYQGGSTPSTLFNRLTSLTATVLTIYGPYYYANATWYGHVGSWQVVEYY